MFCAISEKVAQEPVIDKSTGHLYEKSLIFKYVQEYGKSPLTGEALSTDDLVVVKGEQAVKPRSAQDTSIPGLLATFHNEWDALMLETFQLRKALGVTRQELAQALYQHDASTRVIARLIRERDDARAALESSRLAVPMEEESAVPTKRAREGITKDILEAMTKHSATLSKMRKKRQISETLASADEISAFSQTGSYALHKTTQGGILALDFEAGKENIVYTAGADHTGQVFDLENKRVVAELKGHSKKVTGIEALGKHEVVLTTSADKTSRLWKAAKGGEGGFTCASVLKDHSADVTAATVNATDDYFVTASLDSTWCFYDIATATCLHQVTDDHSQVGGYTAAQFHPDGLILGTGTAESVVRIWEVRQQKNVAKLAHSKGGITSITFSENGYYVATSAADGVKLWDLRKLLNFKELAAGSPTSFVSFDHSGLFLAVGGQQVEVHGVKQDWEVVKSFPDLPKKGVHSGKWGADARSLLVGAADHNLRVYAASSGPSPME